MVCSDKKASTLFLPCGHMCACDGEFSNDKTYSSVQILIGSPIFIITSSSRLIFLYLLNAAVDEEMNENNMNPAFVYASTYCGIIIVCGESMFVDFIGHPYPQIYVPTNV